MFFQAPAVFIALPVALTRCCETLDICGSMTPTLAENQSQRKLLFQIISDKITLHSLTISSDTCKLPAG